MDWSYFDDAILIPNFVFLELWDPHVKIKSPSPDNPNKVFLINDVFQLTGLGIVVYGILKKGSIY